MAIVSSIENVTLAQYSGTANYKYRRLRDLKKQKPFTDANLALSYKRFEWFHTFQKTVGTALPLDCSANVWNGVDCFSDGQKDAVSQLSTPGKLAYNRAYAKLQTRLRGDSADILTLIRERKLLAEMIYLRVHQIADLIDEVRSYTSARGNTSKRAARHRQNSLRRIGALLTTPPQGVVRRTPALRDRQGVFTTPAQLILELRWGWGPLTSDITNSLTGMAKPVPLLPYSASAGYPISFSKDVKNSIQRMSQRSSGRFRVKVGGTLAIENSLIGELERVGLTNYAQSLYETTPYSWLLDYFTTLGDVISSVDDGLIGKMSNVYVTFLCKGEETQSYFEYEGLANQRSWEFGRTVTHMRRLTPSSIPLPQLAIFPPELTPWRIATLVSLLVLKIKKFKALGL